MFLYQAEWSWSAVVVLIFLCGLWVRSPTSLLAEPSPFNLLCRRRPINVYGIALYASQLWLQTSFSLQHQQPSASPPWNTSSKVDQGRFHPCFLNALSQLAQSPATLDLWAPELAGQRQPQHSRLPPALSSLSRNKKAPKCQRSRLLFHRTCRTASYLTPWGYYFKHY